jgi:hypothetical protein
MADTDTDTENYYQKCVDLCRKRGWNATLTALTEGSDGVDWKKMYEEWSKE